MKAGKRASVGRLAARPALPAVTTTVLDLIGVICLAVFAWFVWPPAVLLPIAAGVLFASWSAQHAPRGDDS